MGKNRGSSELSNQDLSSIKSKRDLMDLLAKKSIDIEPFQKHLQYEQDLYKLQIELLKLQRWVLNEKKRVVVVFEGRDAAGKGGAIRRFTAYLNTRSMRVVALTKPTEVERGQWYFRRHVKELPNPGEIVFFDRSWYNRAVVEPVMGFCSQEEYAEFIRQVPEFEHMLFENGVDIVKFWFSISRDEQNRRFRARKKNPLKQWKLSPVDLKAQGLWDQFTYYKDEMFSKTHTSFAPWIIVQTNIKKEARLESIRYLLSRFDYKEKGGPKINIYPDPNIIQRFHRAMIQID